MSAINTTHHQYTKKKAIHSVPTQQTPIPFSLSSPQNQTLTVSEKSQEQDEVHEELHP
jgi:hypothetical protein